MHARMDNSGVVGRSRKTSQTEDEDEDENNRQRYPSRGKKLRYATVNYTKTTKDEPPRRMGGLQDQCTQHQVSSVVGSKLEQV